MPAGLTIYNDENVIQIDSDYENLFYMTKGTVNCATTENTLRRGDITVTGRYPVIALRPQVNAQIRLVSKTGNTWVYRVYIHPNTTAQTLDYWVFDTLPDLVPTSGSGLQIFNNAGKPVFDSDQLPMKVLSSWGGILSGTHSFSFDRPIVIVQTGILDFFGAINASQSSWLINMHRCPTSSSVDFVMQGIGTVPMPSNWVGSRGYYIVDATNLP